MKHCTDFCQHFKSFSDERQLPTQYLHNVQNVHQLQQHTIEVCVLHLNTHFVFITQFTHHEKD